MARARKGASSHASEILGLVAFALAALTAISLLSFDPLDRSFFTAPPAQRGPTVNLAGWLGANLSHALLVGVGLFAYLTPIALVVLGVRRLRGSSERPPRKQLVGTVLLWLSISALLALTVHDINYRGTDGARWHTVPMPAGGLVGFLAALPLTRWVGPVGSLIVLLTALAGSLVLATPLSFAEALDRLLALSEAVWKRLTKLSGQASKTFQSWQKARDRARATAREHAERDRKKRETEAERERERRDEAREKEARATAEKLKQDEIAAAARAAATAAANAKHGLRALAADPAREVELVRPALRQPIVAATVARDPARDLALSTANTLRLPETDLDAGDLVAAGGVEVMAAAATSAVRRARAEKQRAAIEQVATAGGQPPDDPREFILPPLSLLESVSNDELVTEAEMVDNAKVLVAKLKEFAVEGTVQAIHPGPVVTTYEYRPEAGVKYSKIVGLGDDLCLAMKAEGVRIDRISGKSAVGIEVPNSIREKISLRELLESAPMSKADSRMTLALGKDINGAPYVTDLRKMPHLLVAGATGAGKSVAVNCMIVSLLYHAKPEHVRFIMVDPKRIELGVYDGIPHLLVPVVTDPRKASNALRWAVSEMENRYKRLAMTGVRSLEQFNKMVTGPQASKLAANMTADELQPLPYIVILIDELADLMMVSASDVEDSISRLAAMARAVGIHLVLATQRPSVDVITGVIKANFPSRISFRVSSKVDSRTILDSNGAEMLLGKGDMLFMPPGSARLVRVHGAFISDAEVQSLVNYLKAQGRPTYDESILAAREEAKGADSGDMDEMYDESVRVVLETGQASVSMLQRRLRLGYGRAARLVDMMELNNIVGPSQGAKGREILVDRAEFLAHMAEIAELHG